MEYPNEKILQSFSYMLNSHSIPSINIPQEALQRLQHVENTFFATEEYIDILASIQSLEDMDDIYNSLEIKHLAESATVVDYTTVYFFGCGLSGYGIQNWKFQYFLNTPQLRLCVSLPYGNVYADREEESKRLDYIIKLIHFCQDNLLETNSQRLSCILYEDSFAFAISDRENGKIYESTSIDSLLDTLTVGSVGSREKIDWLKV